MVIGRDSSNWDGENESCYGGGYLSSFWFLDEGNFVK